MWDVAYPMGRNLWEEIYGKEVSEEYQSSRGNCYKILSTRKANLSKGHVLEPVFNNFKHVNELQRSYTINILHFIPVLKFKNNVTKWGSSENHL